MARAATVQTYRLFEISPAADPCGDAYRTLSDLKDGGLSPRNAQTLLIVLISDAPKTGSFAITSWDAFGAAGFGQSAPGLAAGAIFEHLVLGFTDLYAVGGAIRAVSGTVSVTRDIGGKRMTGRYDLLFPDGARAVGDFDAPYCNETNMCGDWNR